MMRLPLHQKLNFSLFLLFFFLAFGLLSQPPTSLNLSSDPHVLGDSLVVWSRSQSSTAATQQVTITATVDGYLLNMTGWTSPYATVHLTATQTTVKHHTLADKDGQFVFSSLLLPKETGLFCFFSEDIQGIASIPYCLTPPPSLSSLITSIPSYSNILGDSSAFTVSTSSAVVLAPSASLKETKLKQSTDLDTTGRTVPNSLVNIYLSQEKESFFQKLFPFLTKDRLKLSDTNLYHSTFSDPDGNFVFNLPTDSNLTHEFTLNSATNHGLSPESNPLRYQLYTPLEWFLFTLGSSLLSFLKVLLNFLSRPVTIIFLELMILVLLLKKFFSSRQKILLPVLYQKVLVPFSHYHP